MNKLIEQLATDANLEFDHGSPLGFADKFALLMIEEFCMFTQEKYERDWDISWREDFVSQLKEHFGVK
jgi:hypothetical protein